MSDPRLVLFEAIARTRLVEATYNGQRIRLAPHLTFERHGEQYVSALNLAKTWREGEDPRLGQFKLSGLHDIALVDEAFAPLPGFTPVLPRETDTLILAI